MELVLRKNELNYVGIVYDGAYSHEETLEYVVPDVMPDIENIICVNAHALLRSKEAESGKVIIKGIVDTVVLYKSSAVGMQRMDISMPFSASTSEVGIESDCHIVASVSIENVDLSLINSRKVLLRANLRCNVSCYRERTVFGTECPEENSGEKEFLSDTVSVLLPDCITEKTFSINEEMSVPANKPEVGQILLTDIAYEIEETKPIGNRMLFKGIASFQMLYRSSGNVLASAGVDIPFSQIVEADADIQSEEFRVVLMPTAVYTDVRSISETPGRSISIEIRFVAQAVGYKSRQINYVSDAYSTDYELILHKESSMFTSVEGEVNKNGQFRGVLAANETLSEALFANAYIGTPSYTLTAETGRLSCPVQICAVCADLDGEIQIKNEKYDLPLEIEELTADSICADVTQIGAVTLTVTGEGIEARFPVKCSIRGSGIKEIRPILWIEYNEDNRIDDSGKPSLVLKRYSHGDTLWKLAKSYSSTEALICAANGLSEENPPEYDTLLIIPRKR